MLLVVRAFCFPERRCWQSSMCIEAPNCGGGMDVYQPGGYDPMNTHERTFKYRSKWCGRRMLSRIPERQCWSCKCLNPGVNSPEGVLNVVGIHEPLH